MEVSRCGDGVLASLLHVYSLLLVVLLEWGSKFSRSKPSARRKKVIADDDDEAMDPETDASVIVDDEEEAARPNKRSRQREPVKAEAAAAASSRAAVKASPSKKRGRAGLYAYKRERSSLDVVVHSFLSYLQH